MKINVLAVLRSRLRQTELQSASISRMAETKCQCEDSDRKTRENDTTQHGRPDGQDEFAQRANARLLASALVDPKLHF